MGGVNGRMEDMLALPAAPRRPLLRSAPRRAGPAGSTKPGPSGFARPRAALRRLSASGPRHQTLPGVRRLSPAAAAAAAAPSSSPSCPALCARRGAHSSSFPVCLSCKLPAGRPGPASTPSFPPKHAHSRRRGRAGRRPARRELRSPLPARGRGPSALLSQPRYGAAERRALSSAGPRGLPASQPLRARGGERPSGPPQRGDPQPWQRGCGSRGGCFLWKKKRKITQTTATHLSTQLSTTQSGSDNQQFQPLQFTVLFPHPPTLQTRDPNNFCPVSSPECRLSLFTTRPGQKFSDGTFLSENHCVFRSRCFAERLWF